MTKTEEMTESVLKHISKRDYHHRKWLERQKKFRSIVAQDCYGVQKKKESEI